MVLEAKSLMAAGITLIAVTLIFIFAEKIATWIYRHHPFFAILKPYISEETYIRIWRFGRYFMLAGYILVLIYISIR